MNRLFMTAMASLGLLVLAARGTASAQSSYYNPSSGRPPTFAPPPQPGLSPFLDLRRGANTPGINYYLGTIPEMERRYNTQGFSTAIQDLATRTPVIGQLGVLTPALDETGHAAYFGTTGTYFPVDQQAQLGPMPRTQVSFNRPPGR